MNENKNRSTLVIGGLLIAVGVLIFAGQLVGRLGVPQVWPLFVFGVGVSFLLAAVLGRGGYSALAIPGSIVAVIGLILWLQSAFNWWHSWTYAWGLIVFGVGLGILLHGVIGGQPEARRSGWKVMRTGLALFLVFGSIFEFIFSVVGLSSGSPLVWAILLVVAGVFILISRLAVLLIASEDIDEDDRDLFWPLLLIGVGTIAILTYYEYLPSGRFFMLLSLWPVLLIAAGIQVIFGKRRVWISALLGVLVVAVLFGAVLYGEQWGLTPALPAWTIDREGEFHFGPWKTVRGSGNLKEVERQVGGFDEINLDFYGDLEIVQGEQEGILITADENLLAYITTEVHGDRLVIATRPGFNPRPLGEVSYVVTVKNLKKVELSGAGSVFIDGLTAEELEFDSSGFGKFYLDDLQAEKLVVEISGSGSARVSGEVDRLEVEINGAGSFDGGELQSRQAEVGISGAGGATVWVTEDLDTDISGVGGVKYYGEPAVSQRSSGLGRVERLGEK
ncbi:MAG: DUF2807 domain-containing protein [Anaerolineales bacterium]|nr:DUF2807 domain-containing protein [Anaerolineales bacterium]